jgi:hyperosmotically inducible protein
MNRPTKIITHLSVASLMAISALARDLSLNDTNGLELNGRISDAQLREALKYSDLKGLAVENQENEKLGKVQDFAVDLKSGRIVEVIVSAGGFMGMGSRLTAVPPQIFHHDQELKSLQLNTDREKFDAAPKLDASAWDAGMESNRVVEAYGYYGQQPYFASGYVGDYSNQDGTVAASLPRNMDGSINTTGAKAVDTAHNIEVAATNGDITAMSDNSSCGLGFVEKASVLVGMTITNLQGETVGKVENLILDLSSGRIVAVVVASGTFIGMGGEYSAVPPSAFSFNEATNALRLDVSKDTLANSPHFNSRQWPDLSQPGYTTGIYHAYNVHPYFAYDADNTGRNVRDRNTHSLTPLDQGNSQSDIDLTAQIRKEVMKDGDLSSNAHNCKIITQDGRVTLRGPVNSEDEKNRIAEIANRVASAGYVNNQLDVVSK